MVLLFLVGNAVATELELTLSFAGRPIDTIEARGETHYLGPDSLLLPDGLKVTWGESEVLDIQDRPVFMDRKREQIRFHADLDSLVVIYGDHSGQAQTGRFQLDGPFRLEGPGVLILMDQGRYSLDGQELVLILSGSVWRTGAPGFLMAGVIGLITLILVLRGSRTLRRLREEPVPAKRPR
jgi:hypothetical protein